ncbi:hypothetical protein C8J57DRAFT_1299618 [Mycena rebaudengoi]|nr:hypothetical protein C8J57DRAFT_1719404 [Mycena rebaudengoi]KAJ7280568.1 hypothetical protein C8J57DRAFT_1299618 [Mycena rebaudengoi]
MRFITVLLAAASVVFAATTPTTPTVTTFASDDCSGTPLATFSGVLDEVTCHVGNGTSFQVVVGTIPAHQCIIITTRNTACAIGYGGNEIVGYLGSAGIPITNGCFTRNNPFAAVRLLCTE